MKDVYWLARKLSIVAFFLSLFMFIIFLIYSRVLSIAFFVCIITSYLFYREFSKKSGGIK